MNELDRKLYELLGDKTLSFGCVVKISEEKMEKHCFMSGERVYQAIRIYRDSRGFIGSGLQSLALHRINGETVNGSFMWSMPINSERDFEIIGHEPTIADLHKVFASLKIGFAQYNGEILCTSFETGRKGFDRFDYDCTRSLLSQSEETKLAIVNLIESHER